MYDEIKMTLQVNSKKTQQFWKKKNIYIYIYMDSSKETFKFSLGHSAAPRNSRCLLNDRKKVGNFKQIITNEAK